MGPVPKRADQRRRENKPLIPVTEAVAGAVSTQPAPDPSWHPAAAAWYRSLADSGQSRFYEASDWATAWVAAESLSRDLHPKFVGMGEDGPIMLLQPLSGSSLTALLRASSVLLATEGDRRRMAMELKRAETAEVPDGVSDLGRYRDRLAG